MDSKAVNAEIRRVVWPMLRDAGFDPILGRNAWRTSTESIAVVNFQSFSAHLAQGLGCTSYSFAINLGVYYRCFGEPPSPIMAGATGMPAEFVCQARRHLKKSIKQKEFPREDIWYVSEDGVELPAVVANAC